jgi:glycolate oxidase
VLNDVARVETGTAFLGRELALPVCIAPIGSLETFHPDVTLASRGRTSCGVTLGTEPTIRARSVSGRLEVVEADRGRAR